VKFDVAAGKVWMAIISTMLLLVEKDNCPAPQKKRHDPQEQYSLEYWIYCK
jgi:hypothetical protein